ncbi:MAG: ATP-binding cassette domain-containing protein [Methanobacterium sp.]|uniref:ATP-binding cassette domain-containing protein n=1 Tax=Methanobacterium sp. TaxID=2164 RepID=UPI003C760326
MKYAVETFDITKNYGDFTAVDNLQMKIENNSIFGFLGPNGAGKTTTVKVLTCLAQPTSGTAKVAGYDILENPNEVRQKIGMIPQMVSLYGDLTVKENIHLCADFYGVDENLIETRADDLMEMMDIKYSENKYVSQLSGGMKQKASVVASLIHQPDILFMDEPTIGLDPTTKRILWDLVEELHSEGRTIILCSHDMYEVELLCDNVGIINHGLLAAYDTPQGLKDAMIKERKQEKTAHKSSISRIVNKIKNESSREENLAYNKLEVYAEENSGNTRELSLMISNLDDKLFKILKELPNIYKINKQHSGRVVMDIEDSDLSLTNVLSTIIKNNGILNSISTKDPSLEDVFVEVTTKKEITGEK